MGESTQEGTASADEDHALEPSRRSMRELYRRTWELELLLSGAVLFALIQAPAAVDQIYDRLEPQIAGSWRETVFLAYYYVKLALYTLLSAFLLHLCARAYWIGLIGLQSVFPRGVRWNRSRAGPLTIRVYRSLLPDTRTAILRADRLSSAIFAIAFAVVILFFVSLLVGAFAGTVTLLVGAIVPAVPGDMVFWLTFLLVVLGPAWITAADRKRGERWDPQSRSARFSERVLRVYSRATLTRLHGLTTMTLSTNLDRRLLIVGSTLAGILLVGLFLVKDVLVRRDVLVGGTYTHFPDVAGGLGVDPDHYESLRPPGEVYQNMPSIPDPVITGPYVRLFAPISARRSEEVIAMTCPDAPRFHGGGIRFRGLEPPPADSVRAVIACLTIVLAPQLDGRPVTAPFLLFRDPESGVRGLVAFIPTDSLPPGLHTLQLARWPRENRDEDEPRPPYSIPFWR